MDNKKIKCCFCNREITFLESNNPEPLMEYPNRCCNECNYIKVIPARIANINNYRI